MKRSAPPMPVSVLVVDDSPDILGMFQALFQAAPGPRSDDSPGTGGYALDTAGSGEAAIELLNERVYDLVLTDLKMAGPDGLDVLKAAKAGSPATTVIIMTGYASLETALTAIRGGAYDYITKPFTLAELEVLLANVTDRIRTRREHSLLVRELEDAYRLIAALERDAPGHDAPAGGGARRPEPAPSARPNRRAQGIAAYRAADWTPERAAERLGALLEQGALSHEAFQRLSAALPRRPTVA